MDPARLVKVSKYLAKHLRHQPDRIGLRPDDGGWVEVADLLTACHRQNFVLSLDELLTVVADNDKGRYELGPSAAGPQGRIRATQGHSFPVELGHPAAVPPAVLHHGTVGRFLDAIFADGLLPGGRHDVHLSVDRATAALVGGRRGRPVVLDVDAAAMVADGHRFHVTPNGVWLVAAVPARYLSVGPTSP